MQPLSATVGYIPVPEALELPSSTLEALRRRFHPPEEAEKQGDADARVTVAIALPGFTTSAKDGTLEYCLGVFQEKTPSDDDWADLQQDHSDAS